MIAPSEKSKRVVNPIRHIVDNLNPPSNHSKKLLNFGLGDPTVFGNLQLPTVLVESVKESLNHSSSNGYFPSVGAPNARTAIAQYNYFAVAKDEDNNAAEEFEINPDDVILCSGCSGAIDLVLTAMLNEGDNILVPKPCFPLYEVVCLSLAASVKHYDLKAESNWECDLESMEAQIDEKTKVVDVYLK